ncbi:MAG TPA: hypothetical protein ENG20_01285 [Methanomicrobia archaeon]|nr:hypothetical protein [Methanomicrobia archaeon]
MAINPLGLAGLTMTAAIIAFVLSLIIGALFVWFGAKVAGVNKRRRTWGNAILVVILMLVLRILLGHIGGGIGELVGIIGSIAIIKYVYSTAWVKAIIAWIFMLIAIVVVTIVLGVGVIGAALF